MKDSLMIYFLLSYTGRVSKAYVWFSFEQGEWGLTEWDEEEERKRSVKFVDNIIPDTRAQLKVLSKSYQVRLRLLWKYRLAPIWNCQSFLIHNDSSLPPEQFLR